MAIDTRINWPIGTRVRPTMAAARAYGRFADTRGLAPRDIIGTVIDTTNPTRIHVDWPDLEVGGHGTSQRGICTGHCWFMDEGMVERVDPMPITPAYDPSMFVAGFPPGTIVENIGEMAAGSREHRFAATHRGVVIEYRDRHYVHVRFDDNFIGHGVTTGCPGHCYLFLPGDLRIIAVGSPSATSNIPTEIPRLRVTVERMAADPSRYIRAGWTVKIVNGPTPNKLEVRAMMDKGTARRIGTRTWNHYDLNGIVDKGIETFGVDPEEFVTAITNAAIAKQARDATGTFSKSIYDSELQTAMASQPAIIAIGDQLFSLQPKGVIKANRAMAIIKERVVKIAKDNANRIKIAAETEAKGIIKNAERQLEQARLQIEREKSSLKNILNIPEWIASNNLPVRKWSGRGTRDSETIFTMAIGMEISTQIKGWQLQHTKTVDSEGRALGSYKMEMIRWENDGSGKEIIPILSNYHSLLIWLPFNPQTGAYRYQSARIITSGDYYDYDLPHLTHERCCMELQGMIPKITNMTEYKTIAAAINRGNEWVNMNSLLSRFNRWHPDIQAQCPKGLKQLCDESGYLGNNLPDSYFTEAKRVPVATEAKETFDIETIRAGRIGRGESLLEINLEADGLATIGSLEDEAEETI